ncbi:MAG TPA: PEP-CTERM sorting domain-containing protein, partial [bacterium]|nr:PEP-CTERM sorting domain-containing protein [bacterium]
TDKFLELGFVEVSSNGTDFVRFNQYYLGIEPVESYGEHDPSLIWGFAGKFKQGLGTQFDLNDLAEEPEVVDKTVDLTNITHIRIVDVIGDGSEIDTLGNPIYDPYPTIESAGFDLDAVGVMNVNAE